MACPWMCSHDVKAVIEYPEYLVRENVFILAIYTRRVKVPTILSSKQQSYNLKGSKQVIFMLISGFQFACCVC